MSNISGIDIDAERTTVDRLTKEIHDVEFQLAGINTGGPLASLSKSLATINDDISKMERSHYNSTMQEANRLTQQTTEVSEMIGSNKRRISNLDADISAKDLRLKSVNAELEALRVKWADIDAETFQDATVDTCPACNQSLPVDRVQAARDKALAAFNTSRAERLSDNEKRGLQAKDEQAHLQGEIDALTKEREIVVDGAPEATDHLHKLSAERDAVKSLATDYTTLPARDELIKQRGEVESAITAERDGHAPDIQRIQAVKAELESKRAEVETKIRLFDDTAKAKARILELKTEEKKLAASFEELERQKFLCETFVKLQAEMLSAEINQHFKLVRWQLFETQVNGGVKPVCLVTVGSGTYGRGLNDGNKINAGLDICSAFSRAAELDAPIFVDRAETVTTDFISDMQVIRFIARKDIPVLRVEMAGEAVAA